MDKVLKDLFKDGENDGDVSLKCSDKVNVKCHSLIMRSQSDYFKGLFDFHKDKKEFEILYSSKLVKLLLNKMYNSSYPIGELEIDEMLQLTKMIDEFLVIDREDVLKSLMFSFRMSIKKDNWLTVLKQIYGFDCYKELITQLLLYFRDTILVGDEFLKDDPLKDIELDTDLGRKLYKVILKKLAYLNKQHGYNRPYVPKPRAYHGARKYPQHVPVVPRQGQYQGYVGRISTGN